MARSLLIQEMYTVLYLTVTLGALFFYHVHCQFTQFSKKSWQERLRKLFFFLRQYNFALLFPKERKKTSDFYNATDLELKFEVKEVSKLWINEKSK